MSELLEVEYSRRRERLLRSRAALLVIDIQERLAAAMSPEVMAPLLRNTKILIASAARLGLPIVVSEQYPRGLGPTVPELTAALTAAESDGADVYRFEKLEFSAAASPAFQALPPAEKIGPVMTREQWLVCGMETHVCVYQTARDLVGPATGVHVIADATCSRTKSTWRTGLELARAVGALITCTEAAVFDLLGQAGTDEFKELSRLIK